MIEKSNKQGWEGFKEICSDVADFTASTASRSWEAANDWLDSNPTVRGTVKGFLDPIGAWQRIPEAPWGERFGIGLGLIGCAGAACATRGKSLTPTVATTTATTAIRQTAIKAACKPLVNRVRTAPVKTVGNIGTQVAKSNRTAQLSQILQGPISKEFQVGKQIWSSTKNRSSVENAYNHWKNHKYEFPELLNAKQYVEYAHDFFRKSESTLTRIRPTGEILRYHPERNTFGAFTRDGTPKTLFKPDPTKHKYTTNIEYFYGQ